MWKNERPHPGTTGVDGRATGVSAEAATGVARGGRPRHLGLGRNSRFSAELRIEFSVQIAKLRSKLRHIACNAALAKFDEDRSYGKCACTGGGNVGGAGGGGGGSGVGGAYAALPGRMTNEQLADELLLDPMFQLDESGGCSVENPVFHCIRESFHQVRMCVFCLLFGA